MTKQLMMMVKLIANIEREIPVHFMGESFSNLEVIIATWAKREPKSMRNMK
jgi:hypothetical protein